MPTSPGIHGTTAGSSAAAADFASAYPLAEPLFPPVRAGGEAFDWFLAEVAPAVVFPGTGGPGTPEGPPQGVLPAPENTLPASMHELSFRPLPDAAVAFVSCAGFATGTQPGPAGPFAPARPIPFAAASAATAAISASGVTGVTDANGANVPGRAGPASPAEPVPSLLPAASPTAGALPSSPVGREGPEPGAVASSSTDNGYARAAGAGPAAPAGTAKWGRGRPAAGPETAATAAVATGQDALATLAANAVMAPLPPGVATESTVNFATAESGPPRPAASAFAARGALPFEAASPAAEPSPAVPPMMPAENAAARPFTPAANVVTMSPERPSAAGRSDAPLVVGQSVPHGPAAVVAAMAVADSNRPVLGAGGRGRDAVEIPLLSARFGREEIIAGDAVVRSEDEEFASGEKDKNFLNPGAKELKRQESGVGITVAKAVATMPEFLISPSFAPAAADSLSVARAAAMLDAPTVSDPRGAVAAVLAAATPFSIADGRTVSLQFSVDGAALDVRVELHAGEVRTTFLTDSPELRSALAREWQTLALEPSDRTLRLSVPVIAPNSDPASGSGGFGGGHSTPQQDAGARHQTREFFAPAVARNAFQNGASDHAPIPARGFVPLPTSRHLHTTA